MPFSTTITSRTVLLAVSIAAIAIACSDHQPAPTADIVLTQTSLGQVLTGQGSRTLYFFAPDASGNSNCAGQCRETWPIFYDETLTVGDGLNSADFKTIDRADGAKQTTYKGWPLYYFRNDAQAGDVKGENVGERWFVAKPNYSIMIANRQLVGNDGKNYTSDNQEGTGNSFYFTDGNGVTLYRFTPDKKNMNTFTRPDLSNNAIWPLYETALGEVPSTLNKTDFSVISVAGRSQLTYKGWPLYYFGSDQKQRGNTKGVSVPRPGVWPVVYKTTPEAPSN